MKYEDKPKVLFILFQSSQKANGGVNSILEIILGVEKVTPMVLTQLQTDANKNLISNGVKVVVRENTDSINKIFKFINILSYNLWIYKWLKNDRFDKIHINDVNALIHTIIGIRLAGIKPVFNLRDVFETGKRYGLKWNLINLCCHIVVLSKEMKTNLYYRLPLWNRTKWQSRIHSIYSIVDRQKFNNRSKNDKLNLSNFCSDKQLNYSHHILYVAAFNQKKNQQEFIKHALAKLARNGIIVHFVGDLSNDYSTEALSLVDQLQLGSCAFFHGYQPDIEMYYKAADLTIIPTKREGLARCMIESISCGTPVVSFDVCSAREILVQNDCGIVVGHGDYQGLVSAIINLLGNPSKMQRLGENGYMVSRKLFNRTQIIKQYENIYLESKIQ